MEDTERKKRLDILLVERGLAPSRKRAQALIMGGRVMVNERPALKAGHVYASRVPIHITGQVHPYVSRAGMKLAHALESFKIDVDGAVCLDVGASTGGFTDCLLQHGAASVTAVDVGYGQLDWKLRNDPRVTVMERTNFRYLDPSAMGRRFDLITVDVSFISLRLIVPNALSHLRREGRIIVLVKPQFEVGKGRVGKGGIVRDPALHEAVLSELEIFFEDHMKLSVSGVVPSPVLGAKGNQEFLMLLKKRK